MFMLPGTDGFIIIIIARWMVVTGTAARRKLRFLASLNSSLYYNWQLQPRRQLSPQTLYPGRHPPKHYPEPSRNRALKCEELPRPACLARPRHHPAAASNRRQHWALPQSHQRPHRCDLAATPPHAHGHHAFCLAQERQGRPRRPNPGNLVPTPQRTRSLSQPRTSNCSRPRI